MRANHIVAALIAVQADRISFATPSAWQQWSMPGNAVTVTRETGVEPVRVRTSINAMANLSLSAAVVTPNGDGVGDEIRIEFDALKLQTPRPLLGIEAGLAQHYSLVWDGRDTDGRVVPPGSYLLRLEIEGDSRNQTVQRLVSVAD